MSLIRKIKIWLGLEKPIKPKQTVRRVEHKKSVVNTPKKTLEEKIMSSDDEMAKIAYFNHLAYKKGLTEDQFLAKLATEKLDIQQRQNAIRFEPVPYLQVRRNVRSYLEYTTGNYHKWKEIRDLTEKLAGGKCVICGGSSKDYVLDADKEKTPNTECHEVWSYKYDDKKTRVQKLERLEALCSMCHTIKHLNQHEKHDPELFNVALEVYADLNKISIEKALHEYKQAMYFTTKKENDRYVLDLSLLANYGIENVEEYFNCHNDKFNNFLATWNRGNTEKIEPEEKGEENDNI